MSKKDNPDIVDTTPEYIHNDDLESDEAFEEDKEKEDKVIPVLFSRRNFVRYAIMGIALLVFIFSAISLIQIFSEYQKGVDIYESIQAAVFINETTSMTPEGTVAETTAYESVSYAEVETAATLEEIDMAALHAISSYAIGWIQIPAISRSYPVAQYSDNSYYLNHTFTGEENTSGAIFMDARNYSDFSDHNTIIYGHNMKNGTMFGMLNRYENQSFYNENNTCFYITTDAGIRAYQIAAVCLVPSDSLMYTVDFNGDISFGDFISYVDSNKLYSTGVTILPTDYVVTLSTCTTDSSTRRVVVGKYIGTIKK